MNQSERDGEVGAGERDRKRERGRRERQTEGAICSVSSYPVCMHGVVLADVARCSADDGSSNVVAIAVGASLGGLVVIILIAYLIGRRRKQRSGYETV